MAGNRPCVTRNNFSLVHPTRCVSLLLQSIGEGEKGLVVEDAVQRAMKVRWEWGVICGRWRELMDVCYSYGERRKLRAAVYCVLELWISMRTHAEDHDGYFDPA